MTVLLVWTTGLPCNQGIQLLVHHLVSTVNVLSANLNLKKNTGNVYFYFFFKSKSIERTEWLNQLDNKMNQYWHDD